MPLEYRSTGQDPATWKALEREAKSRSIKVDALLRELVGRAISAGLSEFPAVPVSSPSAAPSAIASGAYLLKEGVLYQHFAAFDADVGPVEDVVHVYRRDKVVDRQRVQDALRGIIDFAELIPEEREIALDAMKFAESRAKLETAWNRAKQSRFSSSPRSSGPRYPDGERYRKCGGCGKLFGNMSSDERRAHNGQDCTRPQSSTVLVEGVPIEKSKLPAYMFDERGDLKSQFRSLEGPPSALPHPAVGGEGA